MLEIDEIKEVFAQQMKNEFDNPSISPFSRDWQKGVDLLFEAIELTTSCDDLLGAFKEVLVTKKGDYKALKVFALYIEEYLNFIGCHTGIIYGGQNLNLMPLMKKLRLNNELSQQRGCNYPYFERENLPNFEGKTEFLAHLCRAYCARNEAGHKQPSWADNDLFVLQNRNSVMVVFLYATLKHYDVLKNAVEKMRVDRETNIQSYQEDIELYLKKVINDFEKWQKRFVAIRSTEKIELYAREELDDENRKAREGTIESLRDNIAEKQMMIFGDAGMGKTTTLEYLTHNDAKKCLLNQLNENIPVHIKLIYLTGERTIANEILNILPLEPTIIQSLLENGNISLFLDGLNEIVVKEKRQEVIKQIQSLINAYPKMRLLISSRESQYFNIGNTQRVPVFQLIKMGEKQILEFIRKNSHQTTQKAIQERMEDPILFNWLRVPMWLKMIIEVIERTGKIYDKKTELMDAFFEQTYERERNNDNSFEIRPFKLLISHLAFSLYSESRNSASEEKISYFLGQKVNNVFELDNFLKKAFEFHILTKDKNKYSFTHEEFFYYFAERGEVIASGGDENDAGTIELDF